MTGFTTCRLATKTALAVLSILLTPAAWAHPHVAVMARAEVLYAPDGRVTGVR
ncbi:DUF1007 family protein, partial [Microvirga massiliensis]|uniref:DUF1007 family protein n=1 Tax=Microvirga massiliensis TaxID=1033741 RepID=UPI000B0F03A1